MNHEAVCTGTLQVHMDISKTVNNDTFCRYSKRNEELAGSESPGVIQHLYRDGGFCIDQTVCEYDGKKPSPTICTLTVEVFRKVRSLNSPHDC